MNPGNEELALEAAKIKSLYNEGESYLMKGDFNSAIVFLTKAIDESKYVVPLDSYMARALCHMNNGKYIDAIKDYLNPLFNTSVNRDADIIRFTNVGYAYYNLGIHSEARNYYNKVLQLNPNDTDARSMMDKL